MSKKQIHLKGGKHLVLDAIIDERLRQRNSVELIASENFVSQRVRDAVGSVFTNKYAEGYPGRRYYGGCENCDEIELYCQRKWKEVFNTDYHVNVQPHSGSQANMAAYFAVLEPGDTVLAMRLEEGAHLSHGSPMNFSGKLYNFVFYGLDEHNLIDYNDIYDKIMEHKPKLVLAGASAYSRIIDFERIAAVIDRCKTPDYQPLFMVDMAHIAGLIAAGEHPSPFGLADIITATTHKTLRGPRGGMIFCKEELAKKIDSAVFPGIQGGPLMHVITGKAVAAEEACEVMFKNYIKNVVKNTKAMCQEFQARGYDIVSGGTDNHLFMIDFSRTHPTLTGKAVQEKLEASGITVNKNCVPGDKRGPADTSGIRIGCAAMTTLGGSEDYFRAVAQEIDRIIRSM